MSARLASEIRTHSSDFTSAEKFDGKSVHVSYKSFDEMKVISLSLSDDSGHSAKRDLLMATGSDFQKELMSRGFEKDLAGCLETLSEALEEMI